MAPVWMAQTSPATSCGQCALMTAPSGCWNLKRGNMSIWNKRVHAAIVAFQFQLEEVSSDLIISGAAAIARGWAEHQEQPVDQLAPEANRRNVPDDVISVSEEKWRVRPLRMMTPAMQALAMRVPLRVALTLNHQFRKSVTTTPCLNKPIMQSKTCYGLQMM